MRKVRANVAECPTPDLTSFETDLGYHFRDRQLLSHALTHSSCKTDVDYSNERLEFLGDAILGFVVSERLFRKHPDKSEGQLTRVKSVVVSRSTLARAAGKLRLAEYLIVGKGVGSSVDFPASLLANAFEAVLAAVYLDGGTQAARQLVVRALGDHVEQVLRNQHEPNYKSLLQQYAQREQAVTPSYRVQDESGPDHQKCFTVVAVLDNVPHGVGTGATKKEAEQMAAAETLKHIRSSLDGEDVVGDTPAQNAEPLVDDRD